MSTVIGTCSECGGLVVEGEPCLSVIPMPPQCKQCNAVPENPYGNVIKMTPRTYHNGWNKKSKWIRVPDGKDSGQRVFTLPPNVRVPDTTW